MKKMVCELCSSNDFSKDDAGFFVCDYCRTKYTVEQAKALIVSGVVSLDRSAETKAAIKLGRLKLEHSSYDEVEQQVERALQINPECAEAWQLKGLSDFFKRNGRFMPEKEFELARNFSNAEELKGIEAEQQKILSLNKDWHRHLSEHQANLEPYRNLRKVALWTLVASLFLAIFTSSFLPELNSVLWIIFLFSTSGWLFLILLSTRSVKPYNMSYTDISALRGESTDDTKI